MVRLRKAQISDARALSVLAEKIFRDTFSEVNTPEDMLDHCQSTYHESIQTKEISDPNYVIYVAEVEGQLAGYIQLRWTACPCKAAASPGELQRLYVDHRYHGKGIAQQLMEACLAEFALRENDLIWLGVWEDNPRAIAFYQKYGFKEAGDHVFMLGSDEQRDIIMVRNAR